MSWLATYRLLFGASCDGSPCASSADAAKVLQYALILLRGNQYLGVADTLPSVCASLNKAMAHCICTSDSQL